MTQRSVSIVLAIVALAAVGGLLAGWYQQFTWYDELVHIGFGFAVTAATGMWLSNRARSLAVDHPVSFALVLVVIGLGIGAAWEILEFAYDHLSGDRDLILGKFDTMTDLLCDLGGGVAAAVLLMVRGTGVGNRS